MTDLSQQTVFKINDIIKVLPHRYPFILIDKLEMIEPGKSLVAIKNVTINEPYFQGHFPKRPVMPGVAGVSFSGKYGTSRCISDVESSGRSVIKEYAFFNHRKSKIQEAHCTGRPVKDLYGSC